MTLGKSLYLYPQPPDAGISRPSSDMGNGLVCWRGQTTHPPPAHHPDSRQGWKLTFNNKVQGGKSTGTGASGLLCCGPRAWAGYTNCCCCCCFLVAALLARSLAFSVAASAVSLAFSLASLAVSTRVLGGASPGAKGGGWYQRMPRPT